MHLQINWGKIFLALAAITVLAFPAATKPLPVANALSFGGTDAYVTFGQTAFTGNGGLHAIPLVTRAEADGSVVTGSFAWVLTKTHRYKSDLCQQSVFASSIWCS